MGVILKALLRPLAGLFGGPDAETLPTWILIVLLALAVWGTWQLAEATAERMT